MRIRRYAARLLSSSPTTAAPSSSSPPPPAASWLHATAAAAADDCCAFCDLGRPAPQEGPEGIKHKGHIAGRVPEPDARGDERVHQAQRPPALEVKKCKTDHGPNANKTAVGLKAPMASSGVNEAALKPDVAGGASLVSEANAMPAVKPRPSIANGDAIVKEGNCKISLLSDANKPEVSGGDHLVDGSATKLEVLKGAHVANEAAHDPESKAATAPGVTSIAPDVTAAPSRLNESGTIFKVTRRTSLARTEGADGPEVTGAASIMHETTKLESAGDDYISGEAAARPEDSGRASSNVDDTSALDKPQLPSCNPNKGNAQLGNAGDASTVQLSGFDAAKVGDSVNSTSNGPVGAKAPTVEGAMPNDRSVTPSVSCVLDIVARSIDNSGRTDVICYARRRGKRKMALLEVKTENIELEDSAMFEKEALEGTDRCESVLSTAGPADVKLADIKKELMDNSAASKVKKTKRNKFECNIDYCRMTFKTKTELSVHKKNMCTVKSCSRLFRSHKYLRRHQSVHNDDMPYKCPWDGCGMSFKWSWDRAEHFKVHAGVKPYKCTTPGCNKIYKFVSDFTRHRRRCKPQR
nr:unnamed protein product [Digitaria exilis]